VRAPPARGRLDKWSGLFSFSCCGRLAGIENLGSIMKIARIMLKINNFLTSLSRTAGLSRASLYLA
jgi:hypothetical protein